MHGICATKPFKEKSKHLQKQDIIAPLGADETAEWCNSFVLVPKANGTARLCLDPAWLNQVLIRLVHRGPTLNNILPKLYNTKYLSPIDVSSGYHSLKLDERSSYLMMLACQFGRYRYKWLPFGAALAGEVFQQKIDETLKELPNLFGIADDILVIGYKADRKDHDETLQRVLQVCRPSDFEIKQRQVSFQVYINPILWGSHIVAWSKTRPTEAQGTYGNATPQNKKELPSFSWNN